MPWAAHPSGSPDGELQVVPRILDPVLVPLGFAPGQVGPTGRQVIFCRGHDPDADDGCVDLVVEVEARPGGRIIDVRYWGFPLDRWHLDLERSGSLAQQLADLAERLPRVLS